MKCRKSIAVAAVSLFVFSLIPMNFLCKNVQAVESYKKYDKSSTEIENKYNIKEKILKVQQSKDFTLLLTKSALYFIKDGKSKKYDLGEIEVLPCTSIQKNDKYIYLAPCKKDKNYNIVTIDTKKIKNNSKDINDFIKVKNINYNSDITNVKIDNKENFYFKAKKVDKDNKNTYMLIKISKQGETNNIVLQNNVKNYEIEEDGTLWIIDNDRISHISEKGKAIKSFKGLDVKDITKDDNGNIWILDGDKVKEIYNGKMEEVYTVAKDSKEISVDSKDKLVVKNTRGFTSIEKGKMKDSLVDSYVTNSAMVLKDNSSDIRILSDAYEEYSDSIVNDDIVLDVNLKDEKFNINNRAVTKFANYYNSILYNGDVYFPQYNTVYRLKNNSMEEYVKFNESDYNEFASDISVDKDNIMYVLGNKNIYVVDKNKNIDKIPLSKMYSYTSVDENILVKDKNGDVYLITKGDKSIKFNKLERKNFRTVNFRSQDGKEPVNIFLNENDEFQFVYTDVKNGYRVYKLDENLLPQEDIRFSNEGLSLMNTYDQIKKINKTDGGKLMLWIGKNMLYTKNRIDEKFIGVYDVPSTDKINSMVKGNDGRVYIGTTMSGVICYGEKVDKDPSHYKEIVPKEGKRTKNNKEWTIKFNMKLDKNTINENNIIVATKDGERQAIKVELSKDETSINIVPKNKYREEQDFYIVVNKNVKSKTGKNLNKPIYGKFTVIKVPKIDDAVKFEIIKPVNMDLKNKDFMELIVNEWRKEFEGKANSKSEILKVGKVTVKEVKVEKETAYIVFNAEIATENNGKIEKDNKNVGLNCKRVNEVWTIIK